MQELLKLIYAAIEHKARGIYTSMPGKLVAYDADTQKAQVKPLIMLPEDVYETNFDVIDPSQLKYVEIDVIFDVPVQHLSANNGAAYIYMPIKKGDIGMLQFTTFSLENYLSGDGATHKVEDTRHHDLSDAYFIPGVLPFKAALSVPVGSTENIIVKNDKSLVELLPSGKLKIEGGSAIKVELIDAVIRIIDKLMTATVPTMMGPQQLSTVVDLGLIKAELETIKV